MSESIECPICMENIDFIKNCVTTECGHKFHTNCLMQNVAHNGFGCPYCRNVLAEEVIEEDDGDNSYEVDEDEEEEVGEFDDNALTSFRMFHQILDGEEIEDEPIVDDTVDEEEESLLPSLDHCAGVDFIVQKLTERNITLEDLVKHALYMDHSIFEPNYSQFERDSAIVYGKIKTIVEQYRRNFIREHNLVRENFGEEDDTIAITEEEGNMRL